MVFMKTATFGRYLAKFTFHWPWFVALLVLGRWLGCRLLGVSLTSMGNHAPNADKRTPLREPHTTLFPSLARPSFSPLPTLLPSFPFHFGRFTSPFTLFTLFSPSFPPFLRFPYLFPSPSTFFLSPSFPVLFLSCAPLFPVLPRPSTFPRLPLAQTQPKKTHKTAKNPPRSLHLGPKSEFSAI